MQLLLWPLNGTRRYRSRSDLSVTPAVQLNGHFQFLFELVNHNVSTIIQMVHQRHDKIFNNKGYVCNLFSNLLVKNSNLTSKAKVFDASFPFFQTNSTASKCGFNVWGSRSKRPRFHFFIYSERSFKSLIVVYICSFISLNNSVQRNYF